MRDVERKSDRRPSKIALLLTLAVAACGPPSTQRIGSIEFDVPAGWQATRQDRASIKVTDGTLGSADSTRPGTAMAVFDIYVNSRQTPDSYRDLVASEKGRVIRESTVKVNGETATVLDIEGESFAGRWTVVLIARGGVLIVYRAAFPNDDDAYSDGRPALIETVESIRFRR